MNSTQPQVSVVIPAYNAAWCVARAVDSALAQTCARREVIVVDDGSSDDTARVLSGYGEAIRVLHKANGGLSSARNAGIAAARGRYVAFLDADDWWLPEKLERQLALMETHPDVGFCSTAASLQSPGGKPLGEWPCPSIDGSTLRLIFSRNAAVAGSGSAVMARRALFAKVGGFDEALKSLEDIDMWMRLAAVSSYACIPETLAVILKNPHSMSRNLDVMRASALTVLRKNRRLLAPNDRKGFWRACYAAVLADYAKWEYRSGHRARALAHLAEGFIRAPIAQGRLTGSLMVAMLAGQRL